MNDTQFIDPIEELMNRISGENDQKETTEPESTPIEQHPEDDEFGTNDLQKEIAAEEAAEQEAIQRRMEELQSAKEEKISTIMPPISTDKEYQAQAVAFQGNTLDIVGKMIEQVVKKNNLPLGGIPVATEADRDLQRHVMGELIQMYQMNGEEITPEFEQLIISNWVAQEGEETPSQNETKSDQEVTEQEAIPVPVDDTPQININVESGTPVTVNVDQDVVQAMSKTNRVNIIVREVSEQELLSSRIVTNSQQEGIIEPYVSDLCDVPLTLPLSAYRCVLRPVNYYEFIQLASTPMSGNSVDQDKKQWSIIYDHVKNVSIGAFKDFEDFLKKTKYADRELLMWGVLIGAADEEEEVPIKCSNPKCKKIHQLKYKPRSIIHVDDELIKEYDYETTHTVSPGDDAIAHFNKVNNTIKRYKLPNTGYIVEIDDRPSAYDFLNRRYPLMNQLEKRFYPDGRNEDTPDNPEYGYLLTHALFISAMSIGKGNKEYRYTNWDDIEKIITTALDMKDQAILVKLIDTIARKTTSPMQFYIENFTCDACGHHDDRIIIPDIGEDLLFQLAQRLASTEIKLNGMESN